MSRRVFNKAYEEWSEPLRRELYRTNFRDNGEMQSVVRHNPETDTFVMLDAGKLIGWALVKPNGLAMFYVKCRYRRQGVAKRLGKRIKAKYRGHNLHMMAHDGPSCALEARLFPLSLLDY